MKITKTKIKKWFDIDDLGIFHSKKEAKTMTEAWEKTIIKWFLIAEINLFPSNEALTCGLCNFNFGYRNYITCYPCPIYDYTCHTCQHIISFWYKYCSASSKNKKAAINNMYQFILLLYYMWKDEYGKENKV